MQYSNLSPKLNYNKIKLKNVLPKLFISVEQHKDSTKGNQQREEESRDLWKAYHQSIIQEREDSA
jgi:hypothetical protein